MKVLVFGASLRRHSSNAALAALAARELTRGGAEADLAEFADFDAPLYNQDLLDGFGFPPGVEAFSTRLSAADAFAIASPEYTFSIPGPLKNLIDWSSQQTPIPWTGKPGLLLSASISSVGGQRGLWALRVPLEAVGAYVYPDMFSLPSADEKLDRTGVLVDQALAERLTTLTAAFMKYAKSLAS